LALVVQRRSGLALALTMDKTSTFTMNTVTLPFFASPSKFSAKPCAKSLPSFAAPSTSSATSCAKLFTCDVQTKFKKSQRSTERDREREIMGYRK